MIRQQFLVAPWKVVKLSGLGILVLVLVWWVLYSALNARLQVPASAPSSKSSPAITRSPEEWDRLREAEEWNRRREAAPPSTPSGDYLARCLKEARRQASLGQIPNATDDIIGALAAGCVALLRLEDQQRRERPGIR